MTTITFDLESRSPTILPDRGAYVYAADPLTEIMCLGYAVDDQPVKIWIPEYFRGKIAEYDIKYKIVTEAEAISDFKKADRFVAHNSIFEYVMYLKKLHPRGWPMIPLERLYDTMAKCAYKGLPLNLENAGEALRLPIKKDSEGHRIMLKLCKPRAARKKERMGHTDWPFIYFWHESMDDLAALFNYCGRDVEAERLLDGALEELPDNLRASFLLDQKINLRGVPIDLESIKVLVKVISRRENELLNDFYKLTGGRVTSPRAYPALKKWLSDRLPFDVPNVNKNTVEKLLREADLPDDVYTVLKIKSELAKSSCAKLRAMMLQHNDDHRLRGIFQWHGAKTGRFTGRGVQLHNPPKECYSSEEYEAVVKLMQDGKIDVLRYYFDDPFYAASKCIRGSIKAPDGKRFISADFHSIEGINLAWLAGEQWVLDAYHRGEDVYKLTAAMILKKDVADITQEERDKLGKIAELACGYQGAAGAVRVFGGKGTDEQLNETIVYPWRAARPMTVQLWEGLEDAAIKAVTNPGKVFPCGRIAYRFDGTYLRCRLPSGRVIFYYRPSYERSMMPWGKAKMSLNYYKAVKGRAVKVTTHGGKLAENVTQATSTDYLLEAMPKLEANDFPIIMHVHDEIMAEVFEGDERLPLFCSIMSERPQWAPDVPLSAKGWIGRRFRK